jgi:GTPase SAR1 family protein
MTRGVYIIGGPGAGKSTLMAQMLEGWEVGPYQKWTTREMFGHVLSHPEKGSGAYLGHLRPEYPGTDALSLSVAPQALLWLQALPLLGLDWVFGEGARLCHMGFLSALAAQTDLTVVHLQVSPEVAAERRAARGGKQLTEQYCKVAATKADNVAAACRREGLRVVTEWGTV